LSNKEQKEGTECKQRAIDHWNNVLLFWTLFLRFL